MKVIINEEKWKKIEHAKLYMKFCILSFNE